MLNFQITRAAEHHRTRNGDGNQIHFLSILDYIAFN